MRSHVNWNNYSELAQALVPLVHKAGQVEMEIYRQDFEVETKKDTSPVTKADRAAEAVILTALVKIAPDIPIIAEEAASEGKTPQIGERFFLVDPLDGTKEFIRKSNEFTVNIALIERGNPVFGIVYAPAIQQVYITLAPNRAVMAQMDTDQAKITLNELELLTLKTRSTPDKGLSIVASKSHMTLETSEFIQQFEVSELKSAGSSLKFCMLAKGDADLYPRFGPTMEWDTAAGHAVLVAAGGQVVHPDGSPFIYGKAEQNYLNPFFIAWAKTPNSDKLVQPERQA
ncbi:MAG: 3'(2'),5'-bisphosphate nucleotidase CysQ [bacterium]|nr:3'(2'),5'-bisphosphate nucleotidase CysQ [bacterium]